MINVQPAFNHMNIPTESIPRALQAVRGRLMRNRDVKVGASNFIKELLAHDMDFNTEHEARITTLALVEQVMLKQFQVEDNEEIINAATTRAKKFLADPMNSWMFATATSVAEATEEQEAVVDGLDVKVAVKSDGSIKKGGKQVLSAELYRKHVTESATPVSNAEFVKILMKELGMTINGARTYAHNASKAAKAAKAS